MDWTFDLFVEDFNKYNISYAGDSENYNEYFISNFKTAAEDFLADWKALHDGHLYDRKDGYVGDAFAKSVRDWFSDLYKETYYQRPHLPMWYYVHLTKLPMSEDMARLFCSSPIEGAVNDAKRARKYFEEDVKVVSEVAI